MIAKLGRLYAKEIRLLEWLKSPFLLFVRLAWGLQFILSGWGKLGNIEGVTRFFESMGIPAPGFNAVLVGGTEIIGGLFMTIGLASRVTTVPLAFAMGVAVVLEWKGTRAGETVLDLWVRNVLDGDPGPFLIAAVIILVFGPGRLSADGLIARARGTKHY